MRVLMLMLVLFSLLSMGFVHVEKPNVVLGEGLNYWFDASSGLELTYWIEMDGEIVKPQILTKNPSVKSFTPKQPGLYIVKATLINGSRKTESSASFSVVLPDSSSPANPPSNDTENPKPLTQNSNPKPQSLEPETREYVSTTLKSRGLASELLLLVCVLISVGLLWKGH